MRPTKQTPNWGEAQTDPKLAFQFVKDKISSMNEDKNFHIAYYSSHELKHMVRVFVQSLKVSGRPQTAFPSLKAHERRQLLRMPRGICGEPGCCRA